MLFSRITRMFCSLDSYFRKAADLSELLFLLFVLLAFFRLGPARFFLLHELHELDELHECFVPWILIFEKQPICRNFSFYSLFS
jgi:hypothetical protein